MAGLGRWEASNRSALSLRFGHDHGSSSRDQEVCRSAATRSHHPDPWKACASGQGERWVSIRARDACRCLGVVSGRFRNGFAAMAVEPSARWRCRVSLPWLIGIRESRRGLRPGSWSKDYGGAFVLCDEHQAQAGPGKERTLENKNGDDFLLPDRCERISLRF